MIVAHSLQTYLEQRNLNYKVHPHNFETSASVLCQEMGIEPDQFAVPIVLQTSKKATLMAVIPLSAALDLNRLRALLQRDFNYAQESEIESWFNGLVLAALPPIPGPFGVPCIVERSLLNQPRIFMRGGSNNGLISMDNASAESLYARYPKAIISNPMALPESEQIPHIELGNYPQFIHQIHNKLDKLQRLPAIPAMAFKIIQQVSDVNTSASELAETIELDPSVAAQVIRYASSPYFGYRGRMDSVQDAITRVLGFELVGNIALGIASGKVFNAPHTGPLGLKEYWKHSLYSALLTQALARKINQPQQVNPAQAYLCGLLHNIGVLMIAHIYPAEFNRLNRTLADQPGLALTEAEQEFMNIGHDHIGGYILEKWRLPAQVVNSAYFHHDENYDGDNAPYVRLVRLSNHLLAREDIGDLGYDTSDLAACCAGLISSEEAQSVFEEVMQMGVEIDSLAECIAA